MKLKIINSRAQATQTKTVFWIIGILVLSAIIFIIFQFDLFGYIQNLPSFGEERGEILEVSEEDIPSGVICKNQVGRILGKRVDKWYDFRFDQGLFAFTKNYKEDGTAKPLASSDAFVVETHSSEGNKEDLKEFYYKGDIGIFKDSKILVGAIGLDGVFRANIWLVDFCDATSFEAVTFYRLLDPPEGKEVKIYNSFVQGSDGCLIASRLHGAKLVANRLLCKTDEQKKGEEIKEFSAVCELSLDYGSLWKISRANGEGLISIRDLSCSNPSTNPIGVLIGNSRWVFGTWGGESVSFFWNALEKKAYVRLEDKSKKALSTGPWDETYLNKHRFKDNCNSFFPKMDCTENNGEDVNAVLKVLQATSFDDFLKQVEWIVEQGGEGNEFTGSWKGRTSVEVLDIEAKILKNREDYRANWIIDGARCLKEDRIYNCKIGAKSGECIKIDPCAFCFVGTAEKERVCGETCFCFVNNKVGDIFSIPIGDQICPYTLKETQQILQEPACYAISDFKG
jgi:hypothetical protein